MAEFLHLKTISEVHQVLGLAKPKHPLISVLRQWPPVDELGLDITKFKITSDLYLLSMKGDLSGSFRYGRNSYDFTEGTLIFMAPDQIVSFENPSNEIHDAGWTVFFHPDLIRKSPLAQAIKTYSFFDYGLSEALHTSDHERQTLAPLVQQIETELQQNIDRHSQDLIIINLEMMLTYCHRYYDRQFHTRTNLNSDLAAQFEQYLDAYFSSVALHEQGLPTVTQCGEALNMSGAYLSDLLKVETGKSAKAHIHAYVIDRAKTALLNTNQSVGEVAYDLGFEYPQHFSKLFKSKTGVTPSAYRKLH